jgi:UDP-glucuronate 4-epimerase
VHRHHGPDARWTYSSATPERIVHLAAQAGVRYSLENPQAHVDSNITDSEHTECARHPALTTPYTHHRARYGANVRMPFSVDDNVDHPVSLYAVTKKSTN